VRVLQDGERPLLDESELRPLIPFAFGRERSSASASAEELGDDGTRAC